MKPWACRSQAALIESLAHGEVCKYLMFWGHSEGEGDVTKACLSQWYPSVFHDGDGARYNTAEHFMMAGKARVFGDDVMLEQILACETAAEAKKLGRKVRGFDDATWRAHRWDIVVAGNIYKFGQDERLREFLLNTKQRVLVEASPRDRIWGIGMGASNEHATDPANWRGLNLLGFALMEARAVLEETS